MPIPHRWGIEGARAHQFGDPRSTEAWIWCMPSPVGFLEYKNLHLPTSLQTIPAAFTGISCRRFKSLRLSAHKAAVLTSQSPSTHGLLHHSTPAKLDAENADELGRWTLPLKCCSHCSPPVSTSHERASSSGTKPSIGCSQLARCVPAECIAGCSPQPAPHGLPQELRGDGDTRRVVGSLHSQQAPERVGSCQAHLH